MKGRELLPVARRLLAAAGRPPDEPFGRSTVNRAYYAAFGEATDYAQLRGFTRVRGAGSHDQVWRWIGRYSDGDPTREATRRAIESQGLFLKTRRHKADYQRGARLATAEPSDAIKLSDRIVKALDSV